MFRHYLAVIVVTLLFAECYSYSANKTLYENLKECKQTSIFVKVLDYPPYAELKAQLNDKNSPSMTIFVPNNDAVQRAQRHLDKLLKRSGYPSLSELFQKTEIEYNVAAMGAVTMMEDENFESNEDVALDSQENEDLDVNAYEVIQAHYRSKILRRRLKKQIIPPGLNMTDILLRYFSIGLKYYVVPMYLPTHYVSANIFLPTLAAGDRDFVALGTGTQRMHISNLLISHPDLYSLLPKAAKENQIRMTSIAISRGVASMPISRTVAATILSNHTQLKSKWRRIRHKMRSDIYASKMYSSVVLPDAVASNGVFHVINKVVPLPLNVTTLLAPANLTLMEIIFNKTGLGNYFNSLQSVTLFAPSDDAFLKMFQSLSKEQLQRTTLQDVKNLLMHHIVSQVVYPGPPDSLHLWKSLPTMFGSPLKLSVTNVTSGYFVDDARVIRAGVLLRNGVMHVIDKVLSL